MMRNTMTRTVSAVATLGALGPPCQAISVLAAGDYKVLFRDDSAMIQMYFDTGIHYVSLKKITTTGDANIAANCVVFLY